MIPSRRGLAAAAPGSCLASSDTGEYRKIQEEPKKICIKLKRTQKTAISMLFTFLKERSLTMRQRKHMYKGITRTFAGGGGSAGHTQMRETHTFMKHLVEINVLNKTHLSGSPACFLAISMVRICKVCTYEESAALGQLIAQRVRN